MIIEWLSQVGASIWAWVAGLFPDWTLPSELTDPNGLLGSVFALGTGLGPFVDWGFVTAVGAIPLAFWALMLSIKAIRALISHIPLFGGKG